MASLTLLTIGLRDVPVVRNAREGAAVVLSPIDAVADTATKPFRNAWHGVADYEDVKAENERLRDQLAAADSGELQATDAERQLADISAVLDLPYAQGVPTVVARVMSGPRSNFSYAVTIDHGRDDGLALGMPVVTAAGLVGRISQVSKSDATVELITAPEFRVGVRIAESGQLGTARGEGRGEPLAVDTGLPRDAEVRNGTGLVTSGLDRSAYPPGIPVGKVTSTRGGSAGLALELVVDPLAKLDDLSYVSVLRWEPPA